jgi:citrate/tricarballylate utilization protein
MTRRLEFGAADMHYLANLCHNCGACLHACQYAPPHEFAVNVPQAMARCAGQTYADYAWPPALGALYQRNGLTLSLALAGRAGAVPAAGAWRSGTLWGAPWRQFLRPVPAQPDGRPVCAGVRLRGAGAGHRRAPASGANRAPGAAAAGAVAEAVHDALRLRTWTAATARAATTRTTPGPTARRRAFTTLTFYGFLLCFASTSVATLYHYLFGWVAPYAYDQPAQAAGHVGGIAAGGHGRAVAAEPRRHPLHGDPAQKPMDRGFIALLFLTSLTRAWR